MHTILWIQFEIEFRQRSQRNDTFCYWEERGNRGRFHCQKALSLCGWCTERHKKNKSLIQDIKCESKLVCKRAGNIKGALSDFCPKIHLQPISSKGRVLEWNNERKERLIWVYRKDISRPTIDRENWKMKKRKIKNIYDQARGRTLFGKDRSSFPAVERTQRAGRARSGRHVVSWRWFWIVSHNRSVLAFGWICLCVIFACFHDRRCHGCVRTCGAEISK